MTTPETPPGRLRGGLSRIRALPGWLRQHKGRIGWAVAEGVIGSAIGVLFISLYLKYR